MKNLFLVAAEKYADVAELADAHGSGPCAARLKGSTPFVGTIYVIVCGYGITAVHQPSKLVIGVRPPLPAPLRSVGFPSGQRGQTVNLLAQLSMVRIHLPPPFTYSTVCKDGFFVLKLPDLRRFLHLAANWWWDRVFPTFFPQNSHNVENFPPPFKLSDRGVS